MARRSDVLNSLSGLGAATSKFGQMIAERQRLDSSLLNDQQGRDIAGKQEDRASQMFAPQLQATQNAASMSGLNLLGAERQEDVNKRISEATVMQNQANQEGWEGFTPEMGDVTQAQRELKKRNLWRERDGQAQLSVDEYIQEKMSAKKQAEQADEVYQVEIEGKKLGNKGKLQDMRKTDAEIRKLEKELEAIGKGGLDPEKQVAIEQKLMSTYLNQNKGFQDVHDAYGRVKAAAQDPSPAGDLALIFNYMKMLDPGSTVREGEFANAENSGSVPTSIINKYNKAIKGERLSENRQDFINQASNLYKSARGNYDRTQKTFTDLSNNYGVNPANVVINLENEGMGGASPKQFKSAREAMASGLPPGTIVMINGEEAEL